MTDARATGGRREAGSRGVSGGSAGAPSSKRMMDDEDQRPALPSRRVGALENGNAAGAAVPLGGRAGGRFGADSRKGVGVAMLTMVQALYRKVKSLQRVRPFADAEEEWDGGLQCLGLTREDALQLGLLILFDPEPRRG